MSGKGGKIYHFADFMLEVTEHRLLRGEKEIYLRPKSFETLVYLIGRAGRLVEKTELLDNIWAGTIVTETTLAHCIEEIRSALDDDAYQPRFLKTVPKIGYKFIGNVELIEAATEEEVIEEYTEVRIQAAVDNPEFKDTNKHSDQTFQDSSKIRLISVPKSRNLFHSKLLRKAVLSLLILIVISISYRYLQSYRNQEIHSLAVLPFINLSADSEQEYFVDGMTEELITKLAKISKLRVISRTSMMRYKGTKDSIQEIARKLRVDAIVEGSVFYMNDKIRVNAQLIQATSDKHLWAESYERDANNIFGLQSEIAGSIARAINARLTPQEYKRLKDTPSISPEAHQAYLKGRYFWNKRTEQGFIKGIEYFSQSIEIDPTFAQAYAGLADCYNLLYDYDVLSPEETAPKARSAAMKAIEIDSTFAEAYASLGFVNSRFNWDWQGAEKLFQRAIELNKNYAIAYHWYALHLAVMGRFDEAIVQITKARELDPLSLIVNTNIGWILYFAGRYDEAENQIKQTLEMDHSFFSAHIKLGWIYEQKGMYDKSINEFQQALHLTSDDTNVISLIGNSYALSGRKNEALKIIDELVQRSKQRYTSPYWIAILYACLGEKDQAFEWLNKACAERSSGLVWLREEPKLKYLHNDPRFDLLLHSLYIDGLHR